MTIDKLLSNLNVKDVYCMKHEKDSLNVFAFIFTDKEQAIEFQNLLEERMFSLVVNKTESDSVYLILKFTNFHSDCYFYNLLRSDRVDFQGSSSYLVSAYLDKTLDYPQQMGQLVQTSSLNYN